MAKDPRYESWLTRHHVAWEYLPSVALAAIDVRASLANQARLGASLDPERVSQYADEMRAGASFPPVIVYRLATSDRYVLITGNHRIAAALRANRATFDAYLTPEAQSDVYLRDLLTRSANIIEGVTLGWDERVQQAMHLVTLYNKSTQEVARHLGISPGLLQNKLRSRDVSDRATLLGLPAQEIPENTAMLLAGIQSDNVFKAAHEVVRTFHLNARETKDIIEAATKRGTEEEQMTRILDVATRPEMKERARSQGGTGTRPSLGARQRLYMALNALDSALKKYPSAAQYQITTQEEFNRMKELHLGIDTRLTRLLNEAQRALNGEKPKAQASAVAVPAQPNVSA